MYRLRMKPLIEAIDVLVNCSGMIHSQHPRLHPKVGKGVRDQLKEFLGDLIPELKAAELDICASGARRLLETANQRRA
jgi:hypothetical protein